MGGSHDYEFALRTKFYCVGRWQAFGLTAFKVTAVSVYESRDDGGEKLDSGLNPDGNTCMRICFGWRQRGNSAARDH